MRDARGEDAPEGGTRGGLEGQVVAGKYQLVRLLGQGGMGAVYEGKNLATLKRCAIKLLLSPELSMHPQIVKRFFREAQASSIIESDHIVQIFDSGSDPATGHPYMVMEMLQGEDLEATITRLGAVHPVAVAKLMLQAATGLAKAHQAGIVHRDIKPANLFLTRRDSGDLTVKVLDFGIAKVKMEQLADTAHGLTRTGSLLGTPLYMSPEQARSAPDIDARSDVWSLGVAMYQLLSGQSPFADSTSLGDLMVSIITADIPQIQDKAPWVSAELAEIVHRAMSRDLSRRFRDGGELRDALARLVPDGPRLVPEQLVSLPAELRRTVAARLILSDDGMLHATTPGALSVTQESPPPKRSSAWIAALGALGIAMAGAAGVLAWRTTRIAPSSAVSAPAAAEAPVAPVASPPATSTYVLAVDPEGVEVRVDGEPARVQDGGVELSGTVGSTRRVRLTLKDESFEETVAITSAGLLPDSVKLAPKEATPSRSTARAAKPPPERPAKPAEPAAAAPPAPPPKKTPQVAKDLGEFGN